MTMLLRAYGCVACGSRWPPDATRWRCDCGGALVLADDGGASVEPVSMGEGSTPLVDLGRARAKDETVNPTGSFKDRGAAVLLGLARAVGAEWVVADSSGNAGIAVAAYAAAAGLPAEVFVPATTSDAKRAVLGSLGATVVAVEGPREAAAAAAVERVETTAAFYASHVHNPWFWEGTGGLVDELDPVPDTLVVPVGNGTLVLGAAAALRRRQQLCRIVAVQVEACAPIAAAFAAGRERVEPVVAGSTAAAGVAIGAPARGAEVLAAVRATGGRVVTVGEAAVLAAADRLGVDPTAGVAPAALELLTDDDGTAITVLTGARR